MPTIRLSVLAACALAVASACDIPTELPKWDTTFVVQAESTAFSVIQVLPSSVTLTNNGSAFSLSLSPTTLSERLGILCPACTALHGLVAPKPAFNDSFASTIALPADVAGASLTSGTINISLIHNFSFDPLRPGATARGSLTITARSGASTLGSATVNGVAQAFPTGSPLAVALPLGSGSISGPVVVTVTVNSPLGDATPIDTNQHIDATATPSNLVISTAQVRIQGRNVTATPVSLDVGDIDEFVTDHVKSGALILNINNPFNVSGTLTLAITGGTRPITKPIQVVPGQSTVTVSFDQSELRAFLGLGHDVALTITGAVSAPGNVTVTPAMVLTVNSQLKLVIGPEDAP